MANNSIGLIELSSIASGFNVADAMLKAADVKLMLSRTVCSGKYLILVRGEVANVDAAVKAGVAAGTFGIIASFVIANLHDSIFPALSGCTSKGELESLGVIESFSIAALIEAADAAAKSANVELLELRLAMALGGKAFATLTGSVAAVQTAVDAAAAVVGSKGMLVNKVVIPRPRPEILTELI
jgi:microcompartment protein CcmL/EutN